MHRNQEMIAQGFVMAPIDHKMKKEGRSIARTGNVVLNVLAITRKRIGLNACYILSGSLLEVTLPKIG